MDVGKKEYLILGIGMILFVKIFDWSNYFMLIGFVFIILAFSDDNNKTSGKQNKNNLK